MRSHGSELAVFKMWIWRGGEIVKGDTAVRQISEDEIKSQNFIFFGKAVSVESMNVDEVLHTFDQLLPLYCFVESTDIVRDFSTSPVIQSSFEFREGVTISDSDVSSRGPQTEIDVVLRSNQIKRQLIAKVRSEGVDTKFGDEIKSGNGGKIDLVGLLPSGELDFYEIKPAVLARHAIREALTQLLEYTYRRGGKEARRLIIVSQAALDQDSEDFLAALRGKGIPIYYRHVPLD